MGLFDSLKKLGEDLSKEIEKNVGTDTLKNIKDAIANANASNETYSSTQSTKEIPSEYSDFPTFSRNPNELKTSNTEKYKRCSIKFYNASEQEISEYITKINSLGYIKCSKIRYEKENTYIIVDTNKNELNLVFHIKK